VGPGQDTADPTSRSRLLTDPLGVVVDLLAGLEPALDTSLIAETVTVVAPGRAQRRRLAHALAEDPDVLVTGRSPAARVVGDLLVALAEAGAVNTSPPRCAGCDKHLNAPRHRGRDWYCPRCLPRRQETCEGCGQTKPVGSRDRHGRPRCHGCGPDDERDPLAIVTEVVRGIDPAISVQCVEAAVAAVTPRTGARRRLAWALAERPELLTGAGAQTPVPSVLKLIDVLCGQGATNLVRPPCPNCGRVITLTRPRSGLRLCRNCLAKSRAEPCARCGAVREPCTRDEDGRPWCGPCLTIAEVNHETCVGCGRRRPVHVRLDDGPRCPSCRPPTIGVCGICGRTAACKTSTATGQPWCLACSQRWARCTRCGKVQRIRGGTRDEPLCATCTRPDPTFWKTCQGCGDQNGHSRRGRCVRCTLNTRLQDLLVDDTGQIRPELQVLAHHLATYERPGTVVHWLDTTTAPDLLRSLATGHLPLTHQALDDLPDSQHLQHLRAILVATGALPERDENLVRLEHWIAATIAGRSDTDEQYLLHRYADWHILRRLRARTRSGRTSSYQAAAAQQRLRAALAFLDFLRARGPTLATATQADLDAWLTSEQTTRRHESGYFIRWAAAQKVTTLTFPTATWDGPGLIDAQARWDQARRLLHDDALATQDRVAGLLILLYAQTPAAITRLTLDHLEISDDQVRLQLGPEPIQLPEPLDALILELAATRRGKAALGDLGTSPWLFPGGQPGRPLQSRNLALRLRSLGIHPAKARTAALFHLATELPAALLARMLGISIPVAATWQRASAGDWTTYAADVATRTTP
jgi:hypothetical protein